MSISLLHGCAQIEMVVPDVPAARMFMAGALGASPIEQRLAKDISGTVLIVDHIGCGEGLFQFCAPVPEYPDFPHAVDLRKLGPCVTNLNFYVDDARHAHELLAARGAETRLDVDLTPMKWAEYYGAANTKSPEEMQNLIFMGTRSLLGFDLELLEPNFRRFCKQTLQYPAFVHPRPAVNDRVERLLRMRVVVSDARASCRNVAELFAPASRSRVYACTESEDHGSACLTLGGLELEFCEPRGAGRYREHLDRFGPGVDAVTFSVRDLADVVTAAAPTVGDRGAYAPSSLGAAESVYEIRARDVLGFDVLLEASMEDC